MAKYTIDTIKAALENEDKVKLAGVDVDGILRGEWGGIGRAHV